MTEGRLRALTVPIRSLACGLPVAALAVSLAGCSEESGRLVYTPDSFGGAEALSQSNAPLYLKDAYAIAHGMARSYATSTNANPAVVVQLHLLDKRAEAALATLSREPQAPEQRAVTANAVAALTNFAAAQTYSTQ